MLLFQFVLTVDIGLECDSIGLPLQFCESAMCEASFSDLHIDFPLLFDFPYRYELDLKGW